MRALFHSGNLFFAVLVAGSLVLSLSLRDATISASKPAPTQPQHVLVMANLSEPYATIDGGARRILARTRQARTRDHWLLATAYPELSRIPQVGREYVVDPELVMSLAPDAIVAWWFQAGQLRQLGIPGVVDFSLSSASQNEVHRRIWNGLSRLAGAQERAQALLARSDAKRRALLSAINDLPGARHPSVLIVMAQPDGSFSLGGTQHYHNETLMDVGANVLQRPTAARFVPNTPGIGNLEQLLRLDPDVILVEQFSGDSPLSPKEMFASNEWQAVRATRQRRIYRMPDLPSFITPLEDPVRLQWLAEVLYPELPRRARQEVRDAFTAIYGHTLNDDEIDRILFLDANRGAAGYERFARSP